MFALRASLLRHFSPKHSTAAFFSSINSNNNNNNNNNHNSSSNAFSLYTFGSFSTQLMQPQALKRRLLLDEKKGERSFVTVPAAAGARATGGGSSGGGGNPQLQVAQQRTSMLREILAHLPGARAADLRRYLAELDDLDEEYRFAMFKAGGAVLEGPDLDALVNAVGVLASLQLFPVIVHGSGPQLNDTLAAAGIQATFIGGIRVTDEKTLEIALRVFSQSNARLVDALEARGIKARPFQFGVFEAELLDEAQYGLVGKVTKVHVERLRQTVEQGYVPVVSSVGHTRSGRALNVNADIAARELALAVRPHNAVYLNSAGGLADGEGRTIPAINLAEDYDRLLAQPWMKHGTRLKLNEIKALLDGLPPSSSVSVVKPADLLGELFSRTGNGTVVRMGEKIRRFDSVAQIREAGIDMPALRSLIESAFGGRLVDDYFDKMFAENRLAHLYVTESMRAAAIITREPDAPEGALYMDKLAVHNSFRGLGIAELLWQKICRDIPTLFWRSRVDNSFNVWYVRQSDGSFRSSAWVIYFYGLRKLRDGERCVAIALGMPKTIIRDPTPPADTENARRITPAPRVRGRRT